LSLEKCVVVFSLSLQDFVMSLRTIAVLALVCFGSSAFAQTVIDDDFSKGDFAALGWKATGDWDVFRHPEETPNNPGPLARFAANKPAGSLTKTFTEIRNPGRLTLSLDYGWGWGDAGQASDSATWMLLDPKGNGYAFKVHRTKANWAAQWANVTNGIAPNDFHWATEEIDASRKSVRDGGGLARVTITRDSDGTWTFSSKDWNNGTGGGLRFTDSATKSFNQLVLVGTSNFDEQLFNRITLTAGDRNAEDSKAIPVVNFLNSIGVVSTFPDRGQPIDKTIEMVRYAGFRWVRGGIEGLTENGPTTIQTYLDLHKATGVKINWGLVSGGTDLDKLLATGRKLAEADALLAFEGNNEPNNWGVTYQGEKGGGSESWVAVAKLQRDLYAAVKADPILKKYPVWGPSEVGAEVDNVGLQYLTIPPGAGTVMPEGTKYADAVNVHNYIYHPASSGLDDNKSWNAADPTSACKVDGLYGNHGQTWGKHFRGYSELDLLTLPKVTTETGCTIDDKITEDIQAKNLLSMYLDQFKRGWSHTAVYLLRDRGDEGGNQSFGFFKPDYTPRKAATYLHNLTTILADKDTPSNPGELNYSITDQPATVHEMLLQKSDGTFQLVIWGERLKGSDDVTIQLGAKCPKVVVYAPTKGTEPVQTLSNIDSLQLTMSNHPFVVAITPK
jgi:hypothetical protein